MGRASAAGWHYAGIVNPRPFGHRWFAWAFKSLPTLEKKSVAFGTDTASAREVGSLQLSSLVRMANIAAPEYSLGILQRSVLVSMNFKSTG